MSAVELVLDPPFPHRNDATHAFNLLNLQYSQTRQHAALVVLRGEIIGLDVDLDYADPCVVTFFEPICVDIRTHEDAYSFDYSAGPDLSFGWERGELLIEKADGIEYLKKSRYLSRFGEMEPVHGIFFDETGKPDNSQVPHHYRYADAERVVHILTRTAPRVLRSSLETE